MTVEGVGDRAVLTQLETLQQAPHLEMHTRGGQMTSIGLLRPGASDDKALGEAYQLFPLLSDASLRVT